MKFVFKIFNIFKTSFHMKHVKLGTSETIVDQNAAIPTLDSDARAIVLVVHQNAIFRLVAGKKVIHGYSVYFCVCWTKEVFLRVVFFFFHYQSMFLEWISLDLLAKSTAIFADDDDIKWYIYTNIIFFEEKNILYEILSWSCCYSIRQEKKKKKLCDMNSKN